VILRKLKRGRATLIHRPTQDERDEDLNESRRLESRPGRFGGRVIGTESLAPGKAVVNALGRARLAPPNA